jgi:predicted permease
MTSALVARLRAVFRRGAVEREMQAEMAAHLEQAVERLRHRGMSDAEARDAARREFGNVALLQEESRDARGGQWIETVAADVRFAFRHFARTPVTAITLILVLSLGIGVNSALFSILQALTMRPAPGVPGDRSLVRIRGVATSRTEGRRTPRDFSVPELNAMAARRETFSAVAGFARERLVLDLADGTDARPLTGHLVTPNFFATLGVRQVIGPGLPAGHTDGAPGAELAVVIAHSVWEQAGADSAIVGRVVRLNGIPVRVAGIAPRRFHSATRESGMPSVWVPLAARAALMGSTAYALASRDTVLLQAIARLTPSTTLEHANAVVRVEAASWEPEQPAGAVHVDYSSEVVPLVGDTEVTSDDEGGIIVSLVGTGALIVLLIACTNVSALLVGAAVARRREIAIRLSLGASRRRVIRQLITESSLIALAGGALGLTLYWWITRLLAWMVVDIEIGPDLGTVGFTAFVALGTGIVFGLSPALHATRLDVSTALKDAGQGATSRSRLQRTFIVAQIVLTQPLLVGIALIVVVTFSEMGGNVHDPQGSYITRVQFGMEGGVGSRDAKFARIQGVMDRVATLPGVEAVVPQADGFEAADVRAHPADRGVGARAQEITRAQFVGAPPGYFAFQRIPLLRGREPVASDTAGREIAVVIDNELARRFWGAHDPIGRRLEVTSRSNTGQRSAVVVGVFDTANVSVRGTGRVYTAFGAQWQKETFLVRTRGNGTSVAPVIRRLARTMVPDIPIYPTGVATLEQLARKERDETMQITAGAAVAGMLALVLASIGLYGVVALSVRQRHREIGIRVALGARPRQVIGMFLSSGVRLSVVGVALGLPLSAAALYFLATSFAASPPYFKMTVIGSAIAVVVVAVASVASWIPARRAAAVDPLVAIRVE